ncbi:MAG: hypothetical protein FWG01_00535 [Betaproteobacteria bacterium]|nr:hypothetical protein [Betaproteobacteria bacterium]
MANPSTATGTMRLAGVWNERAICLLNPVVKSWCSGEWYIESSGSFHPDCGFHAFIRLLAA